MTFLTEYELQELFDRNNRNEIEDFDMGDHQSAAYRILFENLRKPIISEIPSLAPTIVKKLEDQKRRKEILLHRGLIILCFCCGVLAIAFSINPLLNLLRQPFFKPILFGLVLFTLIQILSNGLVIKRLRKTTR